MSDFDLKRYSLLKEFTDQDLEALGEVLEEKRIFAGRGIFREGEESEGLVLIESGRVRLESRRAGNLGVQGPGSAFGGISLLVLGKRECSLIAEDDCHVLELHRTSYRRLVDDAPRTACRLTEAVTNVFVGSIREELHHFVEYAAEREETA